METLPDQYEVMRYMQWCLADGPKLPYPRDATIDPVQQLLEANLATATVQEDTPICVEFQATGPDGSTITWRHYPDGTLEEVEPSDDK